MSLRPLDGSYSAALTIDILSADRSAVYVAVAGDVDMQTADQLSQVLTDLAQRHRPDTLTVDLAGVAILDSRGVAALVEAYHRVQQHGGRLAVVNAQPIVDRVLTIMGLREIFEVTTTVTPATVE